MFFALFLVHLSSYHLTLRPFVQGRQPRPTSPHCETQHTLIILKECPASLEIAPPVAFSGLVRSTRMWPQEGHTKTL